jgi:catechol 2,3-dioxygenase-like lactoylglutathione lyase family enzyme
MKTHLNFSTHDLARSVAFYQTLLDAEPFKSYTDYALFVTEDPGLELALDANRSVRIGDSAHYGVAVDSVQAVNAAIVRLQAAGFETRVEREETCCYAIQTKVWATDPDGRPWEVYAILEETLERDGVECCAAECCAASA